MRHNTLKDFQGYRQPLLFTFSLHMLRFEPFELDIHLQKLRPQIVQRVRFSRNFQGSHRVR